MNGRNNAALWQNLRLDLNGTLIAQSDDRNITIAETSGGASMAGTWEYGIGRFSKQIQGVARGEALDKEMIVEEAYNEKAREWSATTKRNVLASIILFGVLYFLVWFDKYCLFSIRFASIFSWLTLTVALFQVCYMCGLAVGYKNDLSGYPELDRKLRHSLFRSLSIATSCLIGIVAITQLAFPKTFQLLSPWQAEPTPFTQMRGIGADIGEAFVWIWRALIQRS
jgi:hypothetical protein